MTPIWMTRIRYVVGGMLIGGFWYLNSGRTPWEEALRTLGVFIVLMLVMKARLQRNSVHVHLVPLLASKAALIVTAALVEAGLSHTMNNPALVVAIGLGIAVALLGPLGDHRFFTRMTETATATATIDGRDR